MFRYNNKVLKNEEVQNIAITVNLGEEFKANHWKTNERYVHEELIKHGNKIPMSIECPIEDLVYIQPRFEGSTTEGYYIKNQKDYELLKKCYKKVQESFPGKNVQVSVHSDLLSDKYNEFPINLEEFIKVYTLD